MVDTPTPARSTWQRVVLIDQAVSSGTNLLAFAAVALATDATAFGTYALASSLFAVALGAARATSSERVALRTSSAPIALLPTSLLGIAIAFTLACLVLFAFAPNAGSAVWLMAGPLSLVQDRLRYVAFLKHAPAALLSDLVWLGCVVVGGVVAWSGGNTALAGLSMATIVGPLAAVVVGGLGVRGSVAAKVESDLNRISPEVPFVIEGWLLSGTVFVVLLVVAAFGSLADAGEVRVLLLIYQPLFSLAIAGRWRALTNPRPAAVAAWPRRLSYIAVGYVLLATLVLVGMDTAGLGVDVLNVWSAAYVATALGQVARAYHQGVADIARRSLSGRLLVSRAVFSVVAIALALVAIPVAGVTAWAVGLAIAFVVGALVAVPLRRHALEVLAIRARLAY